MAKAFIGIGSNVDRDHNIGSGINQLAKLDSNLIVSTIYESKSFGFTGDNFYNLAVGLDTRLPALDLNSLLREIEDKHGRLRNIPRFSSRNLDLDLLIYDDLVRHDKELDVPRQDIISYAFVLKPLAEIAADFIHPESGLKIGEIWESFNKPEQDLWPVTLSIS
ncbi:MAG: 2-amino-4-hydroxy-6-hydroxymethyldihydropteridine diphosphokinase [Gammaproteobacteria bacterium]|jgi:2-amino-4-hydroxy-6-hydroxymethyldihydropteridine diphosphokinase